MEAHSEQLKGVHVYEGRPLEVEEFNRISEKLFKTDSRIPTWPLIVQVAEDADKIFNEAPVEVAPVKAEATLMDVFEKFNKRTQDHGEQSFKLPGSRAS